MECRLQYTRAALCCVLVIAGQSMARADAQQVLEFRYTPVARAQVAIWIEDTGGRFLTTVALTEAVAYRGIGNRPGASQMNSGYRWPYGRREGVLPVWAHRRAAAPGAALFPRVIFQDRPEGYASRTVDDQSPDDYHCLQFDASRSSRDELDAVSCATVFSSDKGRYLTPEDVQSGYAEPWQLLDGSGTMRPLSLHSVYPPRMDVVRCTSPDCFDHPDVGRFASDARAVMPEIDAITRATAPADTPQRILFSPPPEWPAGDYVAFIEINVEGDYNAQWSAAEFPTPQRPDRAWDGYAVSYGYPYRGQPSIVYELPFRLGDPSRTSFATAQPAGRSSWDHADPDYGRLEPVSMLASDPAGMTDQNGSGADRLRRDAEGQRFVLQLRAADPTLGPGVEPDPSRPVLPPESRGPEAGAPVGAVGGLSLRNHEDPLRSHTWVRMSFFAARSERPIHAYEVRVATEPIVDEASFIRNGRPAKNATDDVEGATALVLPAAVPEGGLIEAAIGDLSAQTHYYVAVRATDDLNRSGPIQVAEIGTTERTFATVSPCFVATAAYGTPLAREITALRALRDRYLASTGPGRALVGLYERFGPRAAAVIAERPRWRSVVRRLLEPIVSVAQALQGEHDAPAFGRDQASARGPGEPCQTASTGGSTLQAAWLSSAWRSVRRAPAGAPAYCAHCRAVRARLPSGRRGRVRRSRHGARATRAP